MGGLTGQKIYEIFMSGDVTPLQAAQEVISELVKDFSQEVEHLEHSQKEMLKYWEGDSADAAGRGVKPLIEAHSESVPLVETTTRSVQYQEEVYTWGKNTVQPVPPEPEEPSLFARGVAAIMPGVPDPEVSYRKGMAEHSAANDNNVRVMQQYSGATTDNSNNLPKDFGIIEDDGAPIYIGTHTSSVGTAHHVGSPSFAQPGAASGAVPTSGGIGSAGPGPSLGGGGVPTPGPAPSPVQGPTASGPTTGVASPVTAGPGGGQSGGGPGGPRPGGPVVAPVGPGGSRADDTSRSRPGGRPGVGPRAGQRMTPGGGRVAGGAAPTGSGAGKTPTVLRGGAAATARLTGGTAGLQAGKGAGMMSGGTPAGGAAAARAAAAGVGGRAGMGGGMAGAAGQRAQGDEDKEHKDKYAVKEELDDGLEIQYDELGAKTVDEKTGHTVVNPVIGETPAAEQPAQQVQPHIQQKDKDR